MLAYEVGDDAVFAAQTYIFGSVAYLPCAGKIMYGMCALRDTARVARVGIRIFRAEILTWIHGHKSGEILPRIVGTQTVVEHIGRHYGDIGRSVMRAVGSDKPARGICLKILAYISGTLLSSDNAGGDMACILKSRKGRVMKKGVERMHYLHICVEIYASLGRERVEPCHVRHEGIFAGVVGLAYIRIDVEVKVVLVPLLYLIVGAMSLPCLDISERVGRKRTSAKPAIMYLLGYQREVFIKIG